MKDITLSGPRESEHAARAALADAGFTVSERQDSRGLPWPASLAFITVAGEDIDAASECVASLGYVLRAHSDRDHPVVGFPLTFPIGEMS